MGGILRLPAKVTVAEPQPSSQTEILRPPAAPEKTPPAAVPPSKSRWGRDTGKTRVISVQIPLSQPLAVKLPESPGPDTSLLPATDAQADSSASGETESYEADPAPVRTDTAIRR